MKNWKPQLLPNDKTGEAIDWEERLKDITNWMISDKLDGARVELIDGVAKSRELKLLPSVHVQRMADQFASKIHKMEDPSHVIYEAEFWAPKMSFSELMHFFKTEDVTSSHTIEKYNKLWNKTKGDPALGWPYPGRSVEWLTTWHPELGLHLFDRVEDFSETKFSRYSNLLKLWTYDLLPAHTQVIPQRKYTHIDGIYQAYDQVILNGGEGLVAIHRDATYKAGRLTLNQAEGFKIKNSDIDFYGYVIDVEEGTEAREGSIKTISELGRSKTSQLKEDRVPSGMTKSLKVIMDDGKMLSVSLDGYNHQERIHLLKNPEELLRKRIKFTGMNPTKEGGVPRHAMYSKGNIEDNK